ncbi:hypothetical protein [Bernardetia litoralis]|uniref:hypothetical protein n=1 Tax=Bernardetia litoralis TaxID=999 RepID=UPI0002F6B343|nr:hypothetical protein [Bernardetia litoralis]
MNNFDNHLGLYYTESIDGELPQDEKGGDKYIQTMYIKIKKSTHSDKEVTISDLYT